MMRARGQAFCGFRAGECELRTRILGLTLGKCRATPPRIQETPGRTRLFKELAVGFANGESLFLLLSPSEIGLRNALSRAAPETSR
jgi:hypothetical protein